MDSGKKCCRVYVDKIMEKLSESVVTEDKHIHILLNNKPGGIIDISEDNEELDDIETDIVPDVIINEVTDEIIDEICLDKNMNMNMVYYFIVYAELRSTLSRYRT